MFVVMVAAGLVFAGKWIAVLTGSAVSQMVVGESIVHLLLITPVVYFAVRAAQRLMVRRPNQLFAEAIAAEGYCPGCGYALAGQRVQGDGCTVCPECGCAVRAGSV